MFRVATLHRSPERLSLSLQCLSGILFIPRTRSIRIQLHRVPIGGEEVNRKMSDAMLHIRPFKYNTFLTPTTRVDFSLIFPFKAFLFHTGEYHRVAIFERAKHAQ